MDDPGRVGAPVRRGVSTLATCFEQFTDNAFRLEGLPSYADPEPPRLRSLRSNRYLQRIARAVLDGKTWTHVRVLDDPPTSYQREQLRHGLIELHALGAHVRVICRSRMQVDPGDFWLFDNGEPGSRAVIMHFADDGTPLYDADELVTDPGRLYYLDEVADELVRLSAPLDEYLAAVDA